jgi:hypothetical protein
MASMNRRSVKKSQLSENKTLPDLSRLVTFSVFGPSIGCGFGSPDVVLELSVLEQQPLLKARLRQSFLGDLQQRLF